MPSQTSAADSGFDTARAKAVIEARVAMPGALLPILHGLQDAFGYVPEAALPLVAEALNLSRAEVHGVLTFYHDFRRAPAGRHALRLCRAEACQSMGGVALEAHAKQRLGVGFNQTTPDGSITLEPVYCLGLCATAPALMWDAEVHGRMNPVKLDQFLTARRDE
jgi:formate dehydrogenase subunit gamma